MNKIFKTLARLLQKARKAIAIPITALYYRCVYRHAMAEADRLNERIYCVKANGKVKFISRSQFKEMRGKGVFPKTFTAVDMRRISLFVMEPKRLRHDY
jgi:hypothetical protein